jgi:hypothetical protein
MMHVPIKADRSRRVVVETIQTLRKMMGWSLVHICILEVVAAALAEERVQPIVHVESSESLLRSMAKGSPLLPSSLPSTITEVLSSTATSWVSTKTSPVAIEHVLVPSNVPLLTTGSHGRDPALEHVASSSPLVWHR